MLNRPKPGPGTDDAGVRTAAFTTKGPADGTVRTAPRREPTFFVLQSARRLHRGVLSRRSVALVGTRRCSLRFGDDQRRAVKQLGLGAAMAIPSPPPQTDVPGPASDPRDS